VRCVATKRRESEAQMAQPLAAVRDGKQFSLQPGFKTINSFGNQSINIRLIGNWQTAIADKQMHSQN
jgi:hypothetical protein